MKPRLTALVCAALLAAPLGCQMDQDGLKGRIAAPSPKDEPAEPSEPSGIGGGSGSMGKSEPMVAPPVMADAGVVPGVVGGEDAGGDAVTPSDALPVAPADATPSIATRPPECDRLPAGPLPFVYRREIPDSDDFTFDNDGYFLTRAGRDIARLVYGGLPVMVVKNVVGDGTTIDSLRVLPGGDIVIADYTGDALVRIDAAGNRRKLASLQRPNKLTRGPGGYLYVVGIDGDVFQVEPDSGKSVRLARIDGRLRGLAFSVDYKTLYVSDPRNDVLYSLQMRPDGTAESPRVFARGLGDGPDGLATDICGNIYVADHAGSGLRRVSPSGTVQVVANLGRGPTSSVGFGSGKQGWDANTLYTVSVDRGGTYEIKIGVPAAPPPP